MATAMPMTDADAALISKAAELRFASGAATAAPGLSVGCGVVGAGMGLALGRGVGTGDGPALGFGVGLGEGSGDGLYEKVGLGVTGMHADCAGLGWCCPTGQRVHAAALAAEKLLTAHAESLMEPAGQKLPAGQALQLGEEFDVW